MRLPPAIRLVLLGLLLALPGCSSIQVSDHNPYQGPELPRPDRIIVYDFAVTPEDMPAFAKAGKSYVPPSAPLNAEELATARKLGAQIAEELVAQIDRMGLSAVRSAGQPPPALNDIVLVGYFGRINQGSTLERVVIGFGEGDAQVNTHVEGYRMTEDGLVMVGSGATSSKGGKGPGLILPTVVTVATANPIGLIVGGTVKAGEALAGKGTAEDTAKQTASKIAEVLKERFQQQGWI